MLSKLWSKRGFSLERLRALLAVADAESLVAAAGGDLTRASLLSRQLTELEEFFGRPLRQRRGRTVGLNADGRRLAEQARWSLQALEDMIAGEGVAQQTVLAAGDAVLHWLVLPRLGALGGRFKVVALPAVEVVARLSDGSVHVGLVRRDPQLVGLRTARLGTLEHALFVPRGLSRGLDDDEIPFAVPLAMQTSDADFVDSLRAWARKRGRALDLALECETFPQVLRAVQSGAYAGVLPTLAEGELRRVRKLPLPRALSDAAPSTRLQLAWDARFERTRFDARKTIDALVAALRFGHEPHT